MVKSRIILLLLVSVLLLGIFTGCAPARRPAPDTTPRQDTRDPRNMDRDNLADDMDAEESNRIAEQLAKEATKVKGVKNVTVVYTNRTAVVGLDLEANIEADRTDDIKQEVSNRIKKANKNVETVSISTDADTVTRIRNIARGVAEGRPVSEFAKELSEITRRITPSIK
jgi:YhcN/YlaJ family sporulation lipoprotein